MLAEDGPNAMLFRVLFCDEPTALEFLQDVGLPHNTDHLYVRVIG
jgi:hypothetical protein